MNTIVTKFFKYLRLFHNPIVSILLLIILIIAPFTTAFSYPPTQHTTSEDSLDITINCTKINGNIKSFVEINSGPVPIYYVPDAVDITSEYQEIGVSFIRTHDFYGPTDVSSIFPNWSNDPNLESSYNFTTSDPCITGIINAGCQVFYRLGESASDNKTLRIPPENFSKWAEICKHIIMHYNDGWNNGHHYNISYWEIWNEPDLDGFWNGTAEQYYHLYHTTIEKLKAYNTSLKIGGPCTSSIFNDNFTTGFLSYLTENNLPLDFYSWHMYADTPNNLYEASKVVRNFLDTYGFTSCENINTEWNINILTPQRDKDDAKNAAFTACSLAAFQDANIDHSFRYRGTQDNNWLSRLIGFDLSIFAADGTYKTPALAYAAMNYLIRDTPIRLLTPEMDAASGITYLAGISEDQTNISIMLSNYDVCDTCCILNITEIPWAGSYRIVHYIIDDSNHLEIYEDTTSNTPDLTLSKTLKQNSIHFIRLTNTSSIPEEGPSVAEIPFLLQLRFLDPILRIIGFALLSIIFS